MFSASTTNTKILKDSIDTVSQIIDEGIFKIKQNSIELMASDRAMVAVIDLKLKSSLFEEYQFDKEMSIGLNLINFLTILKRAGTGDQLTIKIDDDTNKLDIVLKGKTTRKFAVPVLDISEDEIPPINQLEFHATAEVMTDIIDQGIADADVIADSVVIELSPEKLKMISEGNSSKIELDATKGDDTVPDISATEIVKSRYPIDYLKKVMKASRLSKLVKMKMGTDYPMKIEFRGDNVYLGCVLAPRVSED
ncbi:MAG: proliferating cell nuclear antigen (pcna) [Candidatus Aenigmarchaeota archaeon]|nr:proliferating cell nuclear antigen (pcna) [Candidatus Aenigmarchaeota archaeon]